MLLWARADRRERGIQSVAGLSGGIWFILFGLVLVPYYLWQTRAYHTSWRVLGALLALGAPFVGLRAGWFAIEHLNVAPRYVLLTQDGPSVRLTKQLADSIVAQDFARLERLLTAKVAAGQELPSDTDALYAELEGTVGEGETPPYDPYSRFGYHYERFDGGNGFGLWGGGPDRQIGTEDDHWLNWWPDSAFSNTHPQARDTAV
jgi:hypothetical protein